MQPGSAYPEGSLHKFGSTSRTQDFSRQACPESHRRDAQSTTFEVFFFSLLSLRLCGRILVYGGAAPCYWLSLKSESVFLSSRICHEL